MDDGYGEYWTFRFQFHNLLLLLRTFSTLSAAAATDPEGLLREVLGGETLRRRIASLGRPGTVAGRRGHAEEPVGVGRMRGNKRSR